MNRDIKFITVVSAIYGLCSGMFGVLFTLYLDELNISLSTMGVMFSVSSLLGFLVMVILGAQSDVWGRKVVYSVSILLTAISSFFVPFLRGVGELTISKIVKDLAFRTRTSIHSTLVFEHVRKGYAKIIARIQGIQLTLSAAGLMMASTVLSYLGFQGVFIAIGIMLFIAFLIFQIVREPAKPKAKRKSI
ncbi:MFS transporter, partial [Candidatus Bathyarchaeota archaeon]|nr:MFS transporter [Candidatus Bathyarchaeota archaeon]